MVNLGNMASQTTDNNIRTTHQMLGVNIDKNIGANSICNDSAETLSNVLAHPKNPIANIIPDYLIDSVLLQQSGVTETPPPDPSPLIVGQAKTRASVNQADHLALKEAEQYLSHGKRSWFS